MIRALLPAGAILHGTILLSAGYGAGSRAVLLPIALSLLSFVPLPARATSLLNQAARIGGRSFLPLLIILAAAFTFFYGSIWQKSGTGFQPVVHDEHAYLFQAKTFASGRLSEPSPPEPLFFDALHILTEPVYAAKYPPGHALWLAPWIAAAGAPWLGALLATFLSLLLIGLLARPHVGPWGALILPALLGLSPAEMKIAPTYLSQTTFLFGVLLLLLLLKYSFHSGRNWIHSGAAGFALGWLFCTRPLNSMVLAATAAAALLFLFLREKRLPARRCTAAFFIVFILTMALGFSYNRSITGSFTKMPWQSYAERYTPEDRLGFYSGKPLEKREIGPGKRMWLEQVLYPTWTQYTPSFAMEKFFTFRIPYTFLETAPYVILILVPPLLLKGKHRRVALFSLLYISLLHGAYLFYWFPWSNYYHEISPFLLFVPLLGASAIATRALQKNRSGVVLAVGGLLLFALLENREKLPMQLRFIESKPGYHENFERTMHEKTIPPAIVFIRYGRSHNSELDLINNEPDLRKTDRIFVHDLGGERNYRLQQKHFPGRKPYLYIEMSGRVFAGFEKPSPVTGSPPAG